MHKFPSITQPLSSMALLQLFTAHSVIAMKYPGVIFALECLEATILGQMTSKILGNTERYNFICTIGAGSQRG